MKKPIKEKIEYRRKIENGKYCKSSRKNPYKQIIREKGTTQVTRKNFIRSFDRHFRKYDKWNFISVETVEDGVYLLHYAPKKPLKEGDGIWQNPVSKPELHNKDILLFAIEQMAELKAWTSKDYKKIFKAIINENSVSKFDSNFKYHKSCYLYYSEDDTFEKLLKERMGISEKMAKRLISSLFNRVEFPFLYDQQKLTDSPQPSITSEKELFLELNLHKILKIVVSRIQIFREYFLDEGTTEVERIDMIVDYIMVEKYHSYINSKIAYELRDTDISLEEYRKDNYRDVLDEIYENKENYITQFNTFLDGTINYLKKTCQVLVGERYLIDSIAEKIVPFIELNVLESALEEFESKKNIYIARIHLKEDREWADVKVYFETVMEKLQEGKILYELYKELKESSGIYVLLDSALDSEHKHILEQFIRYDQKLYSDIEPLDPLIDLHQAVENERKDDMQLTNEVKEIAEVLDIMVHLPF